MLRDATPQEAGPPHGHGPGPRPVPWCQRLRLWSGAHRPPGGRGPGALAGGAQGMLSMGHRAAGRASQGCGRRAGCGQRPL